MRLKSELWVRAYLRRCAAAGAPAVVARRGDSEAGAIFIVVNYLDGAVKLFGPAPAGLETASDARRFVRLFEGKISEQEASQHLAREADFDSDIWIVEVEDRAGRDFLEDWLQD